MVLQIQQHILQGLIISGIRNVTEEEYEGHGQVACSSSRFLIANSEADHTGASTFLLRILCKLTQ